MKGPRKSQREERTRQKKKEDDKEKDKPKPKQLVVTMQVGATFNLPLSHDGSLREITAAVPVEQGSNTYYILGDNVGGISVFHKNGTLKGRVIVTEDAGGIRGLVRAPGQHTVFFSSHTFGFLSVSQIDLQTAPCKGWSSPLYDIAIDPGFSSSKVILSLEDGDAILFSTMRGKSKVCDFTHKFPRISRLPYSLNSFRGHVLALPSLLNSTPNKEQHVRDLHVFNLGSLEIGHGTAPSRTLVLQAHFPAPIEKLAVHPAPGDRTKAQLALTFNGMKGIEIWDFTVKPQQATSPKGSSSSSTYSDYESSSFVRSFIGSGDSSMDDESSWIDWFPKIGIIGAALVGVVVWNFCKGSKSKFDDMDDDYFKERLKERREKAALKKAAEKNAEGSSGGIKNEAPTIEEVRGDDNNE